MATTTEKERQLACLAYLYEAINETCRADADVAYSSGAASQEESLSHTELFLCKLAQICDSDKGGDTITAVACLKGDRGPEYILCSNRRSQVRLQECVDFLTSLFAVVAPPIEQKDKKRLVKQVLWQILEFGSLRVGLYLKSLFQVIPMCLDDFTKLNDRDLQLMLAIEQRCNFELQWTSTDNSRSLFLKNCTDLINIIQDKKPSLASTLDANARIPGNHHWQQLRHLFGRLHSYRHAADTIVGAAMTRPELFDNFRVLFVPSAVERRSLVPLDRSLHRLKCNAFPDGSLGHIVSNTEDFDRRIADLEAITPESVTCRLMGCHRKKTTVHCEVLLHNHLTKLGKSAPYEFLDGNGFIATSKPPCKLCDVYFQPLRDRVRVRASHHNIYPKWRLPDVDPNPDGMTDDVVESRDEQLDDMIEQMQIDIVTLVNSREAQWRRNDSRTETRAGFRSTLDDSESSMDSRSGGVSLGAASVMSARSRMAVELTPPGFLQPAASVSSLSSPMSPLTPTTSASWGFLARAISTDRE